MMITLFTSIFRGNLILNFRSTEKIRRNLILQINFATLGSY